MATAVVVTERLEPMTCSACGIWFAFPETIMRARREDGQKFYCPNGHPLSWHETEVDRLRKRLAWQEGETTRERAWRQAAEERATKADRKLRRVGHGVCPECKRHFVNVERHMKSKHAEKK